MYSLAQVLLLGHVLVPVLVTDMIHCPQMLKSSYPNLNQYPYSSLCNLLHIYTSEIKFVVI